LAEAENKSDAIGGVNLSDEPTEVADILIDLAQRETRTFSKPFARLLMGEMKSTVRMHKHPLKSAVFSGLEGARRAVGSWSNLATSPTRAILEHLVSEKLADQDGGVDGARRSMHFLPNGWQPPGSAK